MGYLYMTNQHYASLPASGKTVLETDFPSAKPVSLRNLNPIVLDTPGRDSVFRVMKRVYQFLDEWKATCPDASLFVSADPKIAKIVNSYFYEMSDREYEHFSIQDGEIRQYQI